MVVIRKYDKKGASVRYEFKSIVQAAAWIVRHVQESEWCWVFYMKGR